jgi:hypothetical protein
MRGYPVFRVPIEALGTTPGEAANPQVGPIRAEDPGAPTINAKRRRWRPLGVRAAGPAAGTTEVEDVDGSPHRGCWW